MLTNKYYVDELYGAVFVRGLALGGGNALFANDRFVVDGGDGEVRPGFGVNGLAWLARDIVARLSNFWDRWIVDGVVNLLAAILDNLSYVFRAVQNGLVQSYALPMIIGFFLLIAWRGASAGALLGAERWISSRTTSSRSSPTRRSLGALLLLLPPFEKNDDAVRWFANAVASSASW